MTTLSLRSKTGAFVARFYWRDAPTSFSLLAPVTSAIYAEQSDPAQVAVPTVTYARQAMIARDTWLYVEEERKA